MVVLLSYYLASSELASWLRCTTYPALLHFRTPPRVRVRATVKLSAAFFHDESSITIGGGYESAIAPTILMHNLNLWKTKNFCDEGKFQHEILFCLTYR